MSFLVVLLTEFLGYSQTFVGTLAAIIVLCILAGDSNFIIKAIEKFAISFQKEINEITSRVDQKVFTDKEEYKRLKEIITASHNQYSADIHDNALTLWTKINAKLQELIFETVTPNFEKIGNDFSPEITNAPLYTLLYIIVLFVFDEAIYVYEDYEDLLISVLFVFTILSILYWLIKWFFYVGRLRRYIHGTSNEDADTIINKFFSFLSKKNWCLSLLIHLVVVVILVIVGAFLCCLFHDINVSIRMIIFWSFAILFPVVLFGLSRECITFERKRKINILLFHLVLFIIYSIAIIVLHKGCTCFIDDMKDMYLVYNTTYPLKLTAMLFIIFNGLIIPLALPYLCFKVICTNYARRASQIGKRGKEMLQPIFNQINDFIKSLE